MLRSKIGQKIVSRQTKRVSKGIAVWVGFETVVRGVIRSVGPPGSARSSAVVWEIAGYKDVW